MKLNLNQELTDFDDQPIIEAQGTCPTCQHEVGSGKAITAKTVVTRIAAMPIQNDPEGKKAVAAFQAGLKAAVGDDLTPEDVVLLKERLFASGYNNIIKGRVAAILNG